MKRSQTYCKDCQHHAPIGTEWYNQICTAQIPFYGIDCVTGKKRCIDKRCREVNLDPKNGCQFFRSKED